MYEFERGINLEAIGIIVCFLVPTLSFVQVKKPGTQLCKINPPLSVVQHMACCASGCRPLVCKGPPVPLNVNWGAAAYEAARGGIVSIGDTTGASFASGFWVSPRAVATSWSKVARQALGLQVVVYQQEGPPILLDANLVFAVPTLDIAFLVVNPLTVGSMVLAPTVLPISTKTPLAGQSVFSLNNGYVIDDRLRTTFVDGNSMFTGVIQEPSYTRTGYVTDLVSTIPLLPGSIGGVVVRVPDYLVVGMIQYAVDGAGAGSSAGINGPLLAAAVYWATQECPAMSSSYLLGAGVKLALRRSIALGIQVPISLSGGGTSATVFAALPLPTSGVVPTTEVGELGIPCAGATISFPFMQSTKTFNPTSAAFTFAGLQTVTPNPVAPGTPVIMDTGYVRAYMPQVFTDISSNGSAIDVNTAAGSPWDGDVVLDVVAPSIAKQFRVSATPTTTSTQATSYYVPTTQIVISALGMVGFFTTVPSSTALAPAVVVENIVNPSETAIANNFYYVAPFASTDFVNVRADYTTDAGVPGGPLQVYVLDETSTNGTLTIQWQGYALSSALPVCFQVILGFDTVASPGVTSPDTSTIAGEVTFAYRSDLVTGSWAGGPWLTASTLSVDLVPVPPSSPRLIMVPALPNGGDAIYWGVASAQGSNLTSVLASDRTTYMLGPHGEPFVDPSISGVAATTLVAAYPSATTAPFFHYALYTAFADNDLFTVIAVNNVPVGTFDLNNTSLTDALLEASLTGSALAPTVVTVKLFNVNFGAPTTLTQADNAADISKFLATAVVLGQPTVLNGPLSLTTYQFRPLNAATSLGTTLPPSFFSGVVLSTPYSYLTTSGATEPQQAQILSTTFTITITAVDLAAYGVTTGSFAQGVFIVSLVNTDSSVIDDSWSSSAVDSSQYTTVALFITPTGSGGNYVVTTRTSSGYGTTSGSGTTTTVGSTTSGNIIVSFTLSYPVNLYSARVNALSIGRPPCPSFSPTNDIDYPTKTAILVPGTVNFTSLTTALRSVAAVPDVANTYVVTSAPRDYGRVEIFPTNNPY